MAVGSTGCARRSLIYGTLELAIGWHGILIPVLFASLTRAYAFLHAALHLNPVGLATVRFFLAALVIVIPSALMGGTLPVLARIVAASRREYHSDTDWLYALNTFGAAAGILLCAYFLMPTWGIYGAIFTACLMNGAIFVYTLWLAKSGQSRAVPHPPDFVDHSAVSETVGYQQIVTFDHTPDVRQELNLIHRHSLFSVLGELSLHDQSYRGLVADLAHSSGIPAHVVSTDAFPYLEYQTPKGNVLPRAHLLDLETILQRRRPRLTDFIELRNSLEPTDREYVEGLALVDRGELDSSIAALPARPRIQYCPRPGGIAWIQGIKRRIQDRSQPIPTSPRAECP